MNRGLFITFEGPDGSGKSTQIELLRDFLSNMGISSVVTREPGGTEIGEKIRRIILDRNNAEMSDMTEMLLYAASRAQHVDEFIRPNLEAGRMVISDRFVDSSIVYQGTGRRLGDAVSRVNEYVVGDCVPDATFLLKVDPRIGFLRMGKRVEDRIESAGLPYHTDVYNAYLELECEFPERIIGIDATAEVEVIQDRIRAEIEKLIEAHAKRDGIRASTGFCDGTGQFPAERG
ncbi:MAG: dTMP kinase [Clostridiales Family XIII bacterium]|nr:dTMP kinase [Clostridiales Family XIII bacterium]